MLDLFEKLVSSSKIKFGEIRWEERKSLSVVIEDGKIESVNSVIQSGIAMRLLKKGGWSLASLTNGNKGSIEKLWRNLESTGELLPGNSRVFPLPPIKGKKKKEVKEDFREINFKEKREILKKLESATRKLKNIVHTRLVYGESWVRESVVNSFGFRVEQELPRIRVFLTVVAEKNGIKQSSYKSRAALGGWEVVKELNEENFSLPVAKRAVELLDASPPPCGRFRVIVSPKVAGILAHEALGHNLEGDHIIHGKSLLKDKRGERIASEYVTLIDDATYPGAYGSYYFDSEGVPAQKKVLVKEGKVCNFLHSLETAALMDAYPTGNGRAQDYHYPPLVRMSNTLFSPGDCSVEELMERMWEGILIEELGSGGYVLPESGQFMFNIDSSWWVERGQKKKLLRNVSLSGFTLETLLKVKACSKEHTLSESGGTCGKEGQGVPVDDGGPFMLVDGMLVGGRSE
ncbi:TldD/PmbA family protein [Candidatus Calescamantes bacterium]|nr:TldD/PmbA family protein [Candidatus Calescamantes bacterium]